jgi:50S ribosomal subunit-associated GTPase HflX
MSKNKSRHQIKSIILNHGWMILEIIARRMMVLKTLLDVQLALLHTEIDRVNRLLHGVNILMHRTHTPL